MNRIVTAIIIHVLVPLGGVALFGLLYIRMKRVQLPNPPFLPYFVLFFCFGGWLLIGLTASYWVWSGMASLGVFWLLLVAPWITAALGWRLRRNRALSPYHRVAFIGSLAYTGFMLVLLLAWFVFLTNR
jgi:hypothetical protein